MTRVITPRLGLEPRYVAGPPKRFAQAIGAVFSVTAVVLTYGVGSFFAAQIVLGLPRGRRLARSVRGLLPRLLDLRPPDAAGIIPEEVCERCNDIWGTGSARRSADDGRDRDRRGQAGPRSARRGPATRPPIVVIAAFIALAALAIAASRSSLSIGAPPVRSDRSDDGGAR